MGNREMDMIIRNTRRNARSREEMDEMVGKEEKLREIETGKAEKKISCAGKWRRSFCRGVALGR
jgi:hypothetical protein